MVLTTFFSADGPVRMHANRTLDVPRLALRLIPGVVFVFTRRMRTDHPRTYPTTAMTEA